MDFAGLVSDDLRSGSAVFRDFLFRFVRRRSHSKDRSANTPLYSSFRLWIELLIFALSNCDPDMAYTLPGVRSSACPFPIRPAGGWRLGVRAELEQACQQRGLRLFVLAPALPQTQWLGRTRPAHPLRGVLPGLNFHSLSRRASSFGSAAIRSFVAAGMLI